MTKSWMKFLGRNNNRRTTRSAKPRRWTGAALQRLEEREVPAAFTPGNLVIYRVGDGATAIGSAGTIVSLVEYKTDGTAVQVSTPAVTFPSTGAGLKLTAVGSGSSEGMMTLSPDGKLIPCLVTTLRMVPRHLPERHRP